MLSKNNLIHVLQLIALACVLNACSKKMSGTFKVSGKVVDAFDGQGISGVRMEIGSMEGGISAPRHFSPSDTTFITTNTGLFELSAKMDKVCPLFIIKDQLKDGSRIRFKYRIAKVKPVFNVNDKNLYAGGFDLNSLDTSNFIIQFQRLSTLKLNITKNPSIAIDSVVFNNAPKGTKLNSDTTFYFALEPDSINNFLIKRNANTIWQDNFNIDLAGDTIIRNVQL